MDPTGNQPTKGIKQSIVIFTKLKSYQKAQEKVKKLISDLFEEEIKQGRMIVENYSENTNERKDDMVKFTSECTQREQASVTLPNLSGDSHADSPDETLGPHENESDTNVSQHGTQVGSTDETVCSQEDQSNSRVHQTVTVIVVLDARQTRVLVTPRRRDAAVDQWEELQMLAKDVAKPEGSIIIMIYGDESSKVLKDEEILNEKWERVFKFNDEHANYPVLKDRCFSLSEEFNDSQKRILRNYMDEIALFPSMQHVKDVLVVGCHDQTTAFREYLKRHPFLHLREKAFVDTQGMATDELFRPGFHEPEEGQTIVRVYYYKTIANLPIKLCDPENRGNPQSRYIGVDDFFEDIDGWLSLRDGVAVEHEGELTRLVKRVLNSMSTIYGYFYFNYQYYLGYPLPVFDRVILLCHDCDSCFQGIYRQRGVVANYAKDYLEYKNIRISPSFDILPIPIGKQPQSLDLKNLMVEIMKSFIREEHQNTPEDYMPNLLESHEKDDDWLLKMYVMYLCHAGFQHEDFEVFETDEKKIDAILSSRMSQEKIKESICAAMKEDLSLK